MCCVHMIKTIGFSQIACHEDKPSIHGLKSLVRRILWEVLTLFFRLLLIAETGTLHFVLSQNMTVIASK